MKDFALLAESNPPVSSLQCKPDRRNAAFTRLDLLFSLLATLFCAFLVLPLLANTKPRSEQVSCVNNLRQIGQGVRSWASEHDNQNSWWIPASQGGSMPEAGMKSGNPYLEFWWMRFELRNPKILACPGDSRTVCTNWGLLMNVLRNQAVSYLIGLHSYFEQPDTILSGDRNLAVSSYPVSCSARINNAQRIRIGDPVVQWITGNHFPNGNLLLNSGEVQQCSNSGLASAIRRSVIHEDEDLHIVLP